MTGPDHFDLIGRYVERQLHGWTESGTIRGALAGRSVIVELQDGRQVVVKLDGNGEWRLKDK
jgi:hypothetical protein